MLIITYMYISIPYIERQKLKRSETNTKHFCLFDTIRNLCLFNSIYTSDIFLKLFVLIMTYMYISTFCIEHQKLKRSETNIKHFLFFDWLKTQIIFHLLHSVFRVFNIFHICWPKSIRKWKIISFHPKFDRVKMVLVQLGVYIQCTCINVHVYVFEFTGCM